MEEIDGSTLTARQRYWLGQIKACAASGKAVAEYAAEYGFAPQAMYGAKKELVRKGVLPRTRPISNGGRFQRARVVAVTDSEWCICLPNGLSVEFSGAVDGRTLSTILTAAGQLG